MDNQEQSIYVNKMEKQRKDKEIQEEKLTK